MQLRAITARAVQIPVGPKLSRDPGALGIAFVAFEALLREGDLHLGIRSFPWAMQKSCPPKGGRYITETNFSLCEKNLRLGFDNEEGVGIRAT
jgi:hypothetical protein